MLCVKSEGKSRIGVDLHFDLSQIYLTINFCYYVWKILG